MQNFLMNRGRKWALLHHPIIQKTIFSSKTSKRDLINYAIFRVVVTELEVNLKFSTIFHFKTAAFFLMTSYFIL